MSDPDLVIAVGAFGAAVAQLFAEQGSQVVQAAPTGADLAFLPTARTILLVGSAPVPQVELPLSQAAHRWRSRFLPVILDLPRLRVGPVSRTEVRGCSSCYRARTRQHSREVPALDAFERHIQRSDDVLNRGFLGHWPSIAAGMVRLALANLDAHPEAESRKVRHLDLLSHVPMETQVVPVHRCRVCSGPLEVAPHLLSVARLQGVAENLAEQWMGSR